MRRTYPAYIDGDVKTPTVCVRQSDLHDICVIPVLASFMLTQHKLERPSVEEMPPYDWAVGKPVGHFLN